MELKMNRIWSKFLMSYLAVILVVMLVWDGSSTVFIRGHLVKETVQQLEIVSDQVKDRLSTGNVNQIFLKRLSQTFGGNIYLINPDGDCWLSSVNLAGNSVSLAEPVVLSLRKGQDVSWEWDNSPTGHREIALATPLPPGSRWGGYLLLTSPARTVQKGLDNLHHQLIKAALLALLAGILLSLAVSFSMTRQIREIFTGTRRFSREDFRYRIPVITGDELGGIAENINQMAEQLSLSNERRRALLAGVSHEIRTPLTNICGYLEALQDGVITGEDREQTLNLIQEEALFMKNMVNDLIDLSRLNSQNYSINKTDFDLTVTVHRVINKLSSLAAAQRDIVHPSLGSEPLVLRADEIRIEQLLYNLVKNALQFTMDGMVFVRASRRGTLMEITVEDNGQGIEPDNLPLVFDSFYKADPSRSKKHEESGLGLAICKAIVQLHDGEITIDSHPGQGTRVKVSLPTGDIS